MKYRKKPIVVEAWQSSFDKPPKWVSIGHNTANGQPVLQGDLDNIFWHGDWIIKNPYRTEVMSNKEFQATYEPVEDEQTKAR